MDEREGSCVDANTDGQKKQTAYICSEHGIQYYQTPTSLLKIKARDKK
jgi:hypothetical protein